MIQLRKKKNVLEWMVFSVGLVLITGLISYLVYDMVTAQSGPPRIELESGPAEQHLGYYEVPVAVINRGYEVAEGVEVEVELKQLDGKTEKSHFVVQFLPRGATRRGSVTFTTDPQLAAKLSLRVLGYERP